MNVSGGGVTFPKAVDARGEIGLSMQRRKEREAETQHWGQFRKYLFGKETSWVIESSLLPLVSNVLNGGEVKDRVGMFRLLSHCALREDFNETFLCSDRKNVLMSHLTRFEALPPEEQLAAALFLCHAASGDRGRCGLLYISTWMPGLQENGDEPAKSTYNGEVTAAAAVRCLKGPNPTLRSYGLATIFNLSQKLRTDKALTVELVQQTAVLAERFTAALEALLSAESLKKAADGARLDKMAKEALKNLK